MKIYQIDKKTFLKYKRHRIYANIPSIIGSAIKFQIVFKLQLVHIHSIEMLHGINRTYSKNFQGLFLGFCSPIHIYVGYRPFLIFPSAPILSNICESSCFSPKNFSHASPKKHENFDKTVVECFKANLPVPSPSYLIWRRINSCFSGIETHLRVSLSTHCPTIPHAYRSRLARCSEQNRFLRLESEKNPILSHPSIFIFQIK